MKKRYFVAIAFMAGFLFSGLLNAGALFSLFQARSEGGSVIIEWKTTTEENVEKFVLERKSVNGSFFPIATISPKGSNSYYSYTDESVYKPNGELFVYQVKVIDYNNPVPTYTRQVSVNHNVSSVKRTWGSIKAMFR